MFIEGKFFIQPQQPGRWMNIPKQRSTIEDAATTSRYLRAAICTLYSAMSWTAFNGSVLVELILYRRNGIVVP